jgi:hypothetical protein
LILKSGSPNESEVRVVQILANLKVSPERDPQNAQAGRLAFLEEARQLKTTRRIPVEPSHPGAWRQKFQLFLSRIFSLRSPLFKPAAALFIIIALIFGGAGATAVAARGSLPGSPLYNVKLWSEDLQLALQNNPEKEFQLRGEFLDERVAEITAIIERGEIPSEEVETRLQTQIEESLLAALNLPPEEVEIALKQMQERLENHTQALLQLQNHGSENAYETVLRTRLMMLAKMKLVEEKISGQDKEKKQPDIPSPLETPEIPAPKHEGNGPVEPNPSHSEGNGVGPGKCDGCSTDEGLHGGQPSNGPGGKPGNPPGGKPDNKPGKSNPPGPGNGNGGNPQGGNPPSAPPSGGGDPGSKPDNPGGSDSGSKPDNNGGGKKK